MPKDAQWTPDKNLLDLIRLGWAVAEVRGLVDRIVLAPDGERTPPPVNGSNGEAMRGPLATDDVRSAADRLGWASKNLNSLAARIGVESAQAHQGNGLPNLPEKIEKVSGDLKTTIETKGLVPEWRNLFVDKLIHWDQDVRDQLSSWGRRERSAYLFGRELAETYWCLDDEAPDDAPGGWSTLLSEGRVTRLKAELSQLGAAVDARRARCVRASLGRWQVFVADGDHHRTENPAESLDRQAQMWQSLLEADTDLDGLRPPKSFLSGVGAGLAVVRVMWTQLIVLTGFTVLLAYGAWLLTQKQHDGFLSAIVAAVGAIGVTGSALTTKAKAEAVHLIENINAAVDSDLDAVATTTVPSSARGRFLWLRYQLSLPGSRSQLSAIVLSSLSAAPRDRRPEQALTGTAAVPDPQTQLASSDGGSSAPSESVSLPQGDAAGPAPAPAGAS